MWTLDFWKDLGERAVKTFAQAMAAGLAAGVVGILDVPWVDVLSVSAKGTASLVTEIVYE